MIKYTVKRILNYIFGYVIKKKAKKYGSNLHVNHYSTVSKNTILGNNVNFNGMKIYGEGIVTIGDNFHSGHDCLMISENHNYDNGTTIPYDSTYIPKPITIEDNVWIGDRVIILGGAKIGEGAIIQAGSVVVSNIEACAIAGGHPAKVFSHRNQEHYYNLKEQGLIH